MYFVLNLAYKGFTESEQNQSVPMVVISIL